MSTILITGSSRGIGNAIATELNKDGHKLALNCSNNITALDQAVSKLKLTNRNVIGVEADVSNYSHVQKMFEEINKKLGGVDVLVNNAGVSYNGLFSDMTPEEWERVISVNLNSVFNCCHNAIPDMVKKKNGTIINISSIWGVNGASCEAVYSASKGAINAFTTALGKELAPSGIRVNAIACGVVETEMNGFLDEDEKKALTEIIPLGRFAKPEEIAGIVRFLISGASEYITGQTIIADGGWI